MKKQEKVNVEEDEKIEVIAEEKTNESNHENQVNEQ